MGFLDALARMVTVGHAGPAEEPFDRRMGFDRRLGDGLGIGEVGTGADDTTDRPVEGTSLYDRRQWERKLSHILDTLPDSRAQWGDLMTEAGALGFEPDWVAQRQRAEFALLIRRAVADRTVTEAEHRKLELARQLIGIRDDDAEAMLVAILGEAESFFGKPVAEG